MTDATIRILALAQRLRRDEQGVTALEYALIAALIAVAIVGALSTLGSDLNTTFSSIATNL